MKDGANVEMSEEMGGKNIFIFGMKVEDVIALDQRGYNPMEFYQKSSNLRRCLDQIRAGLFRYFFEKKIRLQWALQISQRKISEKAGKVRQINPFPYFECSLYVALI